MNNSSRRKFILDSVQSLGLLGISSVLSNAIVQAIAESAMAQTQTCPQTNLKRYIYLSLNNAPPRWMFDLPLTPMGKSDNTFMSGGFGTGLKNIGGISTVVNDTVNREGENLFLPPVWGSNPNSNDGFYSRCLQHALFVRGIDMEIDNHAVSRYRNQAPALGGYSISGVLAGNICSQMTFPALTIGDMDSPFRSPKSVSSIGVTVGATNPISTALTYFNKDRPPVSSPQMAAAQAQFDQYAADNGFTNVGFGDAKLRADNLVKKGVDVFVNSWASTLRKYEDLVKLAFAEASTVKFLSGSTLPVPESATDKQRIFQPGTFIKNVTDYRELIQADSRVDNLARTFAVMEIMMTMDDSGVLTNNFVAALAGAVSNIHVNGATAPGVGITNDQHDVCSAIAIVITNYYYRALLCCLEEFIRVLGPRMSDTVIHIGSEFNRIPRVDHSGSDHGVSGSSALILTGITSISGIGPTGLGNGPVVVGNILKNNGARGTWGNSAPSLGSKKIRMDDMAVTVAQLLGLDSSYVSQNGVPLFGLIASKVANNV